MAQEGGERDDLPPASLDTKELPAACTALAEAAHNLVEATVPTAAMFDAIARSSARIEALREPILGAQEIAQRAALIADVLEHIRTHHALAGEIGDDGLTRLQTLWERAYLDQSKSSVATLQSDIARFTADLVQPLAEWIGQLSEVKRLEQDFDAIQRSHAKQRWSREYAEALNRTDRLWRVVETVLAPEGHSFTIHDDDPQDSESYVQGQSEALSIEVVGAKEPPPSEFQPSDAHPAPSAITPRSLPLPVHNPNLAKEEGSGSIVSEDVPLSPESQPQPQFEIASRLSSPSVDTVAQSAAKENQADSPEQARVQSPQDAIWMALNDKRIGIAYHIARLHSDSHHEDVPPVGLVAALALAGHIGSPDSLLIQRYKDSLDSVHDLWPTDTTSKEAFNLLLFAAVIQPVLFAPSTGALAVLQQLARSLALAPVVDIANRIFEHCQRLQTVRLDEHMVPLMRDGTELKNEIDEVSGAIVRWAHEQAPSQRFSFVPFARIWNLWMQSGFISQMVESVSKSTKVSLNRVKASIQQYNDDKAFIAHVQETNKDVPKGHSGEIDRVAVIKLRRPLGTLIELATTWVDLMEADMARGPGFVQSTLSALAQDLEKTITDWPERTRKYAEDAPLHTRIALGYVERAVNRLRGIFEQQAPRAFSLSEGLPDSVLSRDLLLIPDLDVNLDHSIGGESEAISQLLRYPEGCVNTLSDAFKERTERGDIGGAYLITEWMSMESDAAFEASSYSLEQVIEQNRSQAEVTRTQLVEDVEHAYARGQIDRDRRDDFAALVANGPRESTPSSLVDALASYEHIRRALEKAHEASVTHLRREQMSYADELADEDRGIWDAAIETGDEVLARELWGRRIDGQFVSSPAGETDYLIDFLASAPGIESSFRDNDARPTMDQIDRAAEVGDDLAGLTFETDAHKDGVPSQLLKPWYELARQKLAQSEPVKHFLEALGLVDVRVSTSTSDATAIVIARPLTDSRLCPLHQYGSTADGKYEVLLNWGSVRNSLIQSIPDTHRHVIVFHFGHLAKDRDWLQQWSLESRRRVIVLDETLVLFLSTVTSGRLRAFFDCTLPFTCVDPFVTTASLVPPELFYGRASERDQIIDKYGSCFVYGGRQIGKTALLRSAEAMFHGPKGGQIARWIDLKANEIGLVRGAETIWDVLWGELGEAGVILPEERPPRGGQERLADRIRSIVVEWTKEDDERRILLLLDEADAFLQHDADRDFRESTRLKGIMDSTDRQFKVVFSGLHNVLRTTERSNHPLAHLGEPICVGPLLDNGEWKEAHELVRQPLSAVGCRFQDSAPIFHILARTNYYPSLIQLFGAELARYIRDRRTRFPYDIGVDDIGNVFRSGTVREAIRQRFQLTLQLDSRYEVIAYAIALEFGTDDNAHASGLDRRHIFTLAADWWRNGFLAPGTKDPITIASFDALLQEMVGLGVLRQVEGSSNHYTLRNLNVLPLLGTTEEIEETLLKERQVPRPYDPATIRAHYKGNTRGMLTFEQEDELRRRGGVSIIAGSFAAGVDGVPDFLARNEDAFRHIPRVTDPNAFERHLTSLRPERHGGTQVCLVPVDSPWNVPWVKRALTALRRIQRGTLIRVVFVATPTTLWRMMEDVEDEDGLYDQLDWVNVEPWDRAFLERWCDDLNLGVDRTYIDSLLEKTGGWAALLKRLDHSLEKSWRDQFRELDAWVAKERDQLLKALGVDDEEVERQMQHILSYDDWTERDMWDLEGDDETAKFPESVLRRRVRWAKHLGLIRPTGDKIDFNPLVRQVLQSNSEL